MDLGADLRAELVRAVATTIERHAEELTTLDQAIGDGDHGLNMKRGFEAVLADVANLSAKPWPDFLKGVGTMLVMKVGGASGPLYGTLFMGWRRGSAGTEPTRADLVRAARSRRCRRAASRSAARRPAARMS
jgi:dihydroxyacetone kinase-like protein